MAQLFHDRKQREERLSTPKEQRSSLANTDFLRPIVADADTGHGGLTAIMKLTKLFVEKGAAGTTYRFTLLQVTPPLIHTCQNRHPH